MSVQDLSSVPGADPSSLYARAGEAWAEGRHEAAAQLLQLLVESEPGHVAGLNTLGLIALNFGEHRRAAAWFERAVAAEPNSAPLWFNLFQALDRAGAPERGLASLDRALIVDPDYLPAILMKADLLERLGRSAESLALYRAILASGPTTDGLEEPALRSLERGLDRVRADDDRRAAELEGPLAGLRAAWPCADFERVTAYAELRTGRRKVYVQQPVGGHFPYLPALEFFPRDHFPWLAGLEAATGSIRSELLALLDEGPVGFVPYVAFDPTLPANQWADLNHSRHWSAWFFWRDGERQDANCSRCPATTALIESLPLLDLPGKGPTAMFSILDPHTRIPPHTGSSNVRATIHLPLVVPPGCGLRVGSQTRPFEAGEAWAFDDTIEHEAWNDSDRPRAILILDVWNPPLTEAERAAVRIIG